MKQLQWNKSVILVIISDVRNGFVWLLALNMCFGFKMLALS